VAFIKFINANPEHKLVPKAHMVVARMLHEKLAQPDKAQQVLTRLVRKYPDHELAAHAQRFLEQLPKQAGGEEGQHSNETSQPGACGNDGISSYQNLKSHLLRCLTGGELRIQRLHMFADLGKA
jgi:hypothetical protein